MISLPTISPATYRRALAFLRLGTELLGKLPRRGDGLLEVAVKALAIADAVERTVARKQSVYEDILGRYDLRERSNEPFVRLFFGTQMAASYKSRRHAMNEHLELIEVQDQRGERLFFQEYRWNKPEVSAEFFHTAGFDFGAVVDALWARYPTGLYLSLKPARYGAPEVTFSAVPSRRSDIVSAKGRERLARDVAAHRERDGEPWAFIAYGPPGTGKSRHVERLAQATGGRLLEVDASSMPSLGVQDLGFLLDVLRPSHMLIDDFDRAPVDETRARLLFLFEHLHAAHAGVTVAVTVNDSTKLDEALLRSERIDEAKFFALPDMDERVDIVEQLLLLATSCHADDVTRVAYDVAVQTDEFSHADLAGLVRRLKRETPEDALDNVKQLRSLAAKSAEKAKAPPGNPDDYKAEVAAKLAAKG